MAYKVFTNGSVLNASEINDNLMNQSVMVFSNSTTRAAALTAPTEGMLTWLEDVNRYEFRNGAGAWVPLSSGGLELIRAATITGVNTLSLGSNADPIFSSTYNNYRVLVSSNNSTDAARSWTLRMRANTTDESGAVYNQMATGIDRAGGAQNNVSVNATSGSIHNNCNLGALRAHTSFDLSSPFLSQETNLVGSNVGFNATNSVHQTFGVIVATNTSYNGLTITNSSGNFLDGTIEIYGYKKA